MSFFNRLKSRKGVTGADVAAAVTVIVLTVGIVTAIYVNTINKSKDNLRFANATRIATNIMENIQKKPYEYLTTQCATNNSKEVNGGNRSIFDTKIPNGFKAKVTVSSAGSPDIARDVIVSVTYKASSSYKTITLNSVKEKELMDMTNAPDISLIPDYKPVYSETDIQKWYFYPVKVSGSNYTITTFSDIEWYDYEEGKYALVYKTNTSDISVGPKTEGFNSIKNNTYAWIPRFGSKTTGNAGISKVQFLYGSSDYRISLNQYGNLFSYGVSYTGNNLNGFESGYGYTSFASGDGLSGVWYQVGGANTNKMGKSQNTVKVIADDFAAKTGFALPN